MEHSQLKTNNGFWQNIESKKIFFGHQSVGFDIIGGINLVTQDLSVPGLKIIESRHPSGTGFFHSKIGKNRNPLLKIDDFYKLMTSGVADSVNVAFFKLCYIDINSKTNVDEVFTKYKSSMDSLKSMYPEVIFIHITSPLRTIDTGLKRFIKKFMGKNTGVQDNFSRNRYNDLLQKEYGASGLVFDLALWESTYKNGGRRFIKYKDYKVYALVNEYSTDGGHLNANGKRFIAEKFLQFLATIK